VQSWEGCIVKSDNIAADALHSATAGLRPQHSRGIYDCCPAASIQKVNTRNTLAGECMCATQSQSVMPLCVRDADRNWRSRTKVLPLDWLNTW
jgi:hypothetical protein